MTNEERDARLDVLEEKVRLQRIEILQLFDLCDRMMQVIIAVGKTLAVMDNLKRAAKEAKDRV